MIGVFDSGVGGLSVLRALRQKLPQADFVYFGDTENAPYGEKSAREIGDLIAMALQRLASEGATDIVSACNSASVSVHSVPIDLLRIGKFNIVEMVLPTVGALAPLGKKIALLGTTATIRSRIYQEAFQDRGVEITAIAVPELAGRIEAGASREEMFPIIDAALRRAVEVGAEIISLSCTHYPFVKEMFEESLARAGSKVVVFDPAEAVAGEVEARFSGEGEGRLRFLISKDSSVFRNYVEKLFRDAPHTVEVAGSIYWSLKTS